MTGFVAFTRRELLEHVRTSRLLVLAIAFLFVGLGSPLFAKVTPELLSRFATDDTGGIELVLLRPPGVQDALFQYQKNFAMLPLLIILLGFGAVAGEKARGTAAMSLVKPVSRTAFLLAKAAVPLALALAGTLVAAGGCLLYTTVLFGEVDVAGFLRLNAMLYLMLVSYQALVLLASVVAPGASSAAGIALGGWVLFLVLGALPGLARFTPAGLQNAAADVVMGRAMSPLVPSLSTAALAVVLCAIADRAFRRQEL